MRPDGILVVRMADFGALAYLRESQVTLARPNKFVFKA